jgi:hypothetical protein
MLVGSKPSRKLRMEQAPASGAQIPTIVVEGSAAGSGTPTGRELGGMSTDSCIGVVSTINSWRSGRVFSAISDRPTEADGTICFVCANSRLAAVPTSPTFRTTARQVRIAPAAPNSDRTDRAGNDISPPFLTAQRISAQLSWLRQWQKQGKDLAVLCLSNPTASVAWNVRGRDDRRRAEIYWLTHRRDLTRTNMAPLRGWAPRGSRLIGCDPDK